MMSDTIEKTMSLAQARAALGNTRGLSNEQIDEAQRAVNAFYAAKPRRACACCGSMIWSEHSGGAWACDRCHRGPDVTQEEWRAAETARRKAVDDHLRATEAATPPPREVLRERLAGLAAAREELAKIERAIPTARAAVTEAESRNYAAETAAETSNVDAAEAIAASFLAGAKPSRSAPTAAAARAELAAAVDAVVLARNTRVILDSRLEKARSSVGYATDTARKAARTVIAAEWLEDLISDAVEARAAYVDAVGALGWLVRNHAVNGDDRRPHQILGDANVPPSAWSEAVAGAGIKVMDDAMAALMLDAAAVI